MLSNAGGTRPQRVKCLVSIGNGTVSRGIYPEETILFPIYTTKQRNFTLYIAGIIFTIKYFKFGLSTIANHVLEICPPVV